MLHYIFIQIFLILTLCAIGIESTFCIYAAQWRIRLLCEIFTDKISYIFWIILYFLSLSIDHICIKNLIINTWFISLWFCKGKLSIYNKIRLFYMWKKSHILSKGNITHLSLSYYAFYTHLIIIILSLSYYVFIIIILWFSLFIVYDTQ